MTYRRLWTEESRERSLDNIVDLLEGYYRCRPSSGTRESGCKPASPHLGYSALGYFEFLNRLGHAYATLPLRVLAQLYTRECGAPDASKYHAHDSCGSLRVEPANLPLFIERDSVVARFGVRCKPHTDLKLTCMGFKDGAGKPYDQCRLEVHDDRGEWIDPSSHHCKLSLESCEYRTITFKVVAPHGQASPSLLTADVHVLSDYGTGCLKLELRRRTP